MNRDWFAIAGGDGMFAIPDPVDPTLIWTNTQDGVLGIYDSKARQSVDVSPYPRDVFTSTTSLAQSPYRFNWNAPLAFSPQDGHVAYFGGNVDLQDDRSRTALDADQPRPHPQREGAPARVRRPDHARRLRRRVLRHDACDRAVAEGRGDDLGRHRRRARAAHARRRRALDGRDARAAGRSTAASRRSTRARSRPEPRSCSSTGTISATTGRTSYVTDDYGASWRAIASNLPPDAPVRVAAARSARRERRSTPAPRTGCGSRTTAAGAGSG